MATLLDMSSPPSNFLARAMLLAAGRGERMRPLTDHQPKPLLEVQGKPLIEWQLLALAQSGCHQLLINTAWLGQQIPDHFGSSPTVAGRQLSIDYSHEGRDFGGALETAGGIARALLQLEPVFWVLAADVYTPGFVFSQTAMDQFTRSDKLAHLWLVPNPAHNPGGDFGLSTTGLALNLPKDAGHTLFTYSTIALFRRALFKAPWCTIPPGNPQGVAAPLAPLLRAAMDQQLVSAELYLGPWTDVGTPTRLAQLNLTPTENIS